MAISQTKRQSDLEKRLQILRRQVYGKGLEKNSSDTPTYQSKGALISSGAPSRTESFRTDSAYLYQDLLKILIFSSFAIGAQIILFILLQNHVLKLNFF